MVTVTVEASSRDAHFTVMLCARGIEQAVDVASTYSPSSEVRVVFPIEPSPLFAEDATLVSEPLRLEVPRAGTVR